MVSCRLLSGCFRSLIENLGWVVLVQSWQLQAYTQYKCISWALSCVLVSFQGQLQSRVGLTSFSRKQNHTQDVWTSYLGWFWNQAISAALRKDFLHVSVHLNCTPFKSMKGQVGLIVACRCCQPCWGSSLWQELGFIQESRGPKSKVSRDSNYTIPVQVQSF